MYIVPYYIEEKDRSTVDYIGDQILCIRSIVNVKTKNMNENRKVDVCFNNSV